MRIKLRKGPVFLTLAHQCTTAEGQSGKSSGSSSFWSFLTPSLPLGTFRAHKDLGILGNENQPEHILTLSLNNCGFCLAWSRSSFFGWDFLTVRSEKHPNILANHQENIALTGEGGLRFPRTFLCILWDWELYIILKKYKQINESTNIRSHTKDFTQMVQGKENNLQINQQIEQKGEILCYFLDLYLDSQSSWNIPKVIWFLCTVHRD